ncbi:unnamed protein product [Ilex paraguariensis]|uniref:Uncharacterized protein n=1 Tax=Ilex paraguariensis TaxID=185542 RepID=A0ABC8R9L7_9AQUA
MDDKSTKNIDEGDEVSENSSKMVEINAKVGDFFVRNGDDEQWLVNGRGADEKIKNSTNAIQSRVNDDDGDTRIPFRGELDGHTKSSKFMSDKLAEIEDLI